MNYQVLKQYFSKTIIESILLIFCLSVVFITPLFVNEELYDPIRSGKIFFFVQWLVLLIPFGSYAIFRNRKQAVGKLPLFVLAWFLWIFLRGKFGGIWNDEKFFWFAGCFVFYFLAEAILTDSIKKKHFDLIMIPSIVIALIAAIEAILGLLQIYGGFQVYHGIHIISGTFFNPAPYACFLLSSVPFSLYLTTLKRGNFINHMCNWLGYISVILLILVILSTSSRASYLGLIVVVLVWIFYRYKPILYIKRILNQRRNRIITYTIVPALIIALLTGLYLFKKDSANGRLLIWKVTLQSIKEKPLIGLGFNSVQASLAPAQAAYFGSGKGTEGEEMLADSVKWTFNEPLQTASETGLIGLLLFLLVTGYAVLYKIPKAIPRSHYIKIGTARASLLGIMIFGCFSYPFYSAPITILFFYSLAVLGSFNFNTQKKSNLVINESIAILIIVGTVVLGTFYILKIPKQKKAYWLWSEAITLYQMKVYANANESFAEAYPMLKHNGLFLQQYAKSLSMVNKNEESIKMLLTAQNYYKDDFSYIIMGDNYKAIDKYTNAEEQYQLAAHIIPHKFYPLYLLAKLYDESGQKEKAIAIANEVLEKDVKVESTAIEEIKVEMKTIINNN